MRDTPLPEWLYENGIGEDRAILVENGRILEGRIERHGEIRAGLVAKAQFVKQLTPGKWGIARLDNGRELALTPIPKNISEGARIMVEVTRAAIQERLRGKWPLARVVENQPEMAAPTLFERISRTGWPVNICHPHEGDRFALHGWGELLEEAESGKVDFAEGSLIIDITAAMNVIDVDGNGPVRELALAAARQVAMTIRRHDLQGSIIVDFPNPDSKQDRQAIVGVLDDHMTGPFERTAVNGFGLVQIVRKRNGPSLPEIIRSDPDLATAMAAFRQAEFDRGTGDLTIVARPSVIVRIESHMDWVEELSRRIGRPVALRGDMMLAIGGYYAE